MTVAEPAGQEYEALNGDDGAVVTGDGEAYVEFKFLEFCLGD